jgi:glyoxylase-like metal-dependent hydrolase (beta-lactamase superfamily II)
VTRICDGQQLRINGRAWKIIPVPGHCDDDIALFNPDTGILLSGDLVFRTVPTWLGPNRSDLALYLDSLERIQRLPGLKRILPAHGSPIENPGKTLARALELSNERTAQVAAIVAAAGEKGICFRGIYHQLNPKSSRGIVLRIAHALGVRPALSGGWIAVRLKYLKEQAQVEAFPWKGQVWFRSTA